MTTPLLTTKLYIPPPRPNLVPRPRLIERLEEGVRQGARLSLVSAPAGFGKTTLVAEWICASTREVAWLSLDETDDDPVRFLTYLIAALQQIDGRTGQAVQPFLQSPQLPPTQSLITPLVNDVAAAGADLILVLDDLHLVSSPTVHQILGFLLEHQPPNLHLVVSTRQDPPLPLHQWRARGQMTEIRERDLRFTPEEAAAFLQQTMGLRLSPQAVAALESRTEGWITGLQLAALALYHAPGDISATVATFTGDDRYVVDYLVAEVLQRQPEPIRQFLRRTAILDRLTAPLCNAMTGRDDAQAILEQMERANLFLIPLDHRREWYRYHRLFAEVLRTSLDPEEQRALHHRAARWCEAYGLAGQAIHHALAYGSAAHDWTQARRLIRAVAEETLLGGALETLRGWLDALPEAEVQTDGELALYRGWLLALGGDLAGAEAYVAAARLQRATTEGGDANRSRLLVLRSFIAVLEHEDYEAGLELAARALDLLGEDQGHWRVIALWTMAESQERTRDIGEAIATLREAVRTGRALGEQIFTTVTEMSLAKALNDQARYQEALAVCTEAIERQTDEAGGLSPLAGILLSRLAMLHYEANELALSRQYHERGLALCKQLALEYDLTSFLGLSAPTLYAQGEVDAALDALREAYQFASSTGQVDAAWFLAWEANIHLCEGDLPFVVRWAETEGLSPDGEPHYLLLESHLVYARLLLVQGRLADARRWLARLEQFVRERNLHRWLITVHILQALAAGQSGDRAAARELLSQALRIAAPGGYVRAFLDEDRRALALLPEVRATAPALVDRLLEQAGLSDLGRAAVPVPPAAQPLVEPLSERELEVLRLVAAGLSNREIAAELVIAVGTVKRHLHNIYGKLGVHSRIQAAADARDLGLL
jgi:LuxR family maltose regulon positive regulatory protein